MAQASRKFKTKPFSLQEGLLHDHEIVWRSSGGKGDGGGKESVMLERGTSVPIHKRLTLRVFTADAASPELHEQCSICLRSLS